MIQLAWASSADQLVITKTGLPHPAYTDSTGCWLQSSRTTSRITYLPQLYFIFLAYTKPTLIPAYRSQQMFSELSATAAGGGSPILAWLHCYDQQCTYNMQAGTAH
jgi:hypothetical protein